jgi:type II secretory pathway pseudopilin PulG
MDRARDRGRGERGYNLVALVIGITILNVLLAASLPLWSTAIRREKEEELIFRGLQYAEAIRVYRNRFSQLPTRLEDLIEKKPRSIRQLFKDPMTENGKWGLIFEGQPLQPQVPAEDQDGRVGEDDGDEAGSSFAPGKGTTVAIGPIKGVYSLSGKETVLLWNGQQQYNRWAFSVDLLNQGPPPGIPPPPPGQGLQATLPLSTRWIGRPLRPIFGLQGGTLPGGGGPVVPVPGLNLPGQPGAPLPGQPGAGPPRRRVGGDPANETQ